LLVVASAGSADPDERADQGTQERNCTGDALTWCNQYIFAPDRDEQIGSYDPKTGTYLGNDGQRHSCP
jgi:hypothetical protein